jgi:hypothetical protein
VEVITGVVILLATLLMFSSIHIRDLEARLPDYETAEAVVLPQGNA